MSKKSITFAPDLKTTILITKKSNMKITSSQLNDIRECLHETSLLTQKMNDTLVGIIKSASKNKIIRTDKQKVRDFQGDIIFRDKIYAYVYDINRETYVEEKVSAVAVFEDKTIGVLLCGDVEFGEDTTDEILLESSDWVTAEGGMLLATHTLYNICGNILEYL